MVHLHAAQKTQQQANNSKIGCQKRQKRRISSKLIKPKRKWFVMKKRGKNDCHQIIINTKHFTMESIFSLKEKRTIILSLEISCTAVHPGRGLFWKSIWLCVIQKLRSTAGSLQHKVDHFLLSPSGVCNKVLHCIKKKIDAMEKTMEIF